MIVLCHGQIIDTQVIVRFTYAPSVDCEDWQISYIYEWWPNDGEVQKKMMAILDKMYDQDIE